MEEDILSFGHQAVPQVKDFQCPVCLKYFSRKFTLETHLLIHQGVKPHTCPFCGKSFRQKGTLMRHEVLHSNKNFFHCSLCNRSFRQKNIFFHHLRHRHNVSTENLDRRRCSTQLAGSQTLIDSLPTFAFADTTAIASSGRHLEAVLFQSYSPHVPSENFSQSAVLHSDDSPGSQLQENSEDQKVYSDQHSALLEDMPDMLPGSSSSLPSSTSFMWKNLNSQFSSDIDSKGKFRITCGLCFRLFVSQLDYNHHIEVEHNAIDMFVDQKPVIDSPEKSWRRHRLIESGSLSPIFENASRNQTSASIALSSESNLSASSSEPASVGNVSSEVSLTCIPCQLDFTAEEEFECHVKMHVQSVLCDPDSIDDQKQPETSIQQSLNENNSLETAATFRMKDRFPGKASPNISEMYPGTICLSSEENNNDDINKHRRKTSYRKGSVYNGSTIPFSKAGINPFSGSSAQSQSKFCWRSDSKDFFSNKTENMASCRKTSPIIDDDLKLASVGGSHNFIQTYPPMKRVFMCPFCRKYCVSAKALCLHTKMHLQSLTLKKEKLSRQPTKSEFYHKIIKKHKERMQMKDGKSKRYCVIQSIKTPIPKNVVPYKNSFKKGYRETDSSAIEVNVMEQKQNYLKVENEFNTNAAANSCEVLSRGNNSTKPFFKFSIDDLQHKHNESIRRKKIFKCEQCGKIFYKRIAFQYHLQMHLTVGGFTCYMCKQTFSKKAMLLQHTRLNHIKCFTCGECLRVFQYRSIFKYHVRNCAKGASSCNNDKMNLPLVNMKQLIKRASEGIIGFIPVSQNVTGFRAYDKCRPSVAIPIISTLHPNALKTVPVIGCLSVSKNMYSSLSSK